MISLAKKLILSAASWRGYESPAYFLSATISTLSTQFTRCETSSDGALIAYAGIVLDTINYAVIVVTDAAGAVLWQRKISGTNHVHAGYNAVFNIGIKFDASNNLHVLFRHDVANSTLTLLKYNSGGTLQWQRTVSKSARSVNNGSLDVDSSGNVYVCCTATDATYHKGYLLKYNSGGALQWQVSLAHASGLVEFHCLSVASTGDVFIAGQHTSSYALVVKYNNAGGRAAYARYTLSESPGGAGLMSMCLDAADNVYAAAAMTGSDAYQKCTVSKFNSSLASQWHKWLGLASVNFTYSGNALGADASNVIVSCHRDTTPYGEYIVALDKSTGATSWTRKLTVYSDANTTFAFTILPTTDSLNIVGRGKVDGTTVIGYAGHVPASNTLGTFGTAFTLGEPSPLTVSSGTYSSAAQTWTDAAGDLTDAAGGLTDAAASLTITKHNKV